MKTEISISQFTNELYQNILPFWTENTLDMEHGGFFGGITNNLRIQNDIPRSAVSCARFLWTFSLAYRVTGNQRYLDVAHRAYDYLLEVFWDSRHGGLYWSVDLLGKPIGAHKHSYAQAFGIYGLCEYYKATGFNECLKLTFTLSDLLETYAYDSQNGGYLEGCAQDWSPLLDKRLGADDLNCSKSMNTMLHILEAYTNFVIVSGDQRAKNRLMEIIRVFQSKIISPQNHFFLYFNSDWTPLSNHMSYGHDIEGSWLMMEAADTIGDRELTKSVSINVLCLADAVLKDGIRYDNAIIHEASPEKIINPNIEWWPQAEAVVGFYNAYQLTNEEKFLNASLHSWEFINTYLVDRSYGGWIKRLQPDRSADENSLKVGPWEGPYHESRMCFEMIKRLNNQRN